MAEQLFDHFADLPALEKEKARIIEMFSDIKKGIVQLSQIGIKIDSSKGVTQMTAALKEWEQVQAKITNGQKKLIDIEAKARIENAKAIQQEEKARQEALKTKEKENKERERSEKISASEKKLMDDIGNEYKQLALSLKDAEQRYKNLALVKGMDNQVTQQALKEALSIRGVLDKVDHSLQNYQRSVGNYGNATAGLRLQLNQLLRETPALAINLNTFILALSNNLPLFFDALAKVKAENIDLAASGQKTVPVFQQIIKGLFSWQSALTIGVTLITLFADKIGKWVSGLFSAKDATLELAEAQKDLADSIREVNELSDKRVRAIAEDPKTRTDIQDAKDKVSLLQQQGAEGKKLFDAKRDLAQKELKLAKDQADEKIKRAEREDVNISNGLKGYQALGKAVQTYSTLYQAAYNSQENALEKLNAAKKKGANTENLQKEFDSAKSVADANRQAYESYVGVVDNLNQKNHQLLEIGSEETKYYRDKGIEADKEAAARAKKIAQEIFEYKKNLLEQEIEDRKNLVSPNFILRGDIVVPQTNSQQVEAQLKIRKEQFEKEKELIDLERDYELKQEHFTVEEELKIKSIANRKKIDAEKIYQESIVAIRKSYQGKTDELFASVVRDSEALTSDLAQKEADALLNSLNNRQQLIELSSKRRLELEVENLEKGLITKEVFEQRKLTIEKNSAKESLENQITYYEGLTLLIGLPADKEKDALEKLRQLRKQVAKQDLDDTTVSAQRKIELLKELRDKYVDLAFTVAETFNNIIAGAFDSQKNQIQEQIDLVDKWKTKEIDRINATVESEEKKAAKIKIIEAKAQSEKEAAEARQREIDRRKTIFERAFRAFQISASGFEALAKIKANIAVLLSNPLTAAYAPIAAAQIPITVASTAAQLVALLATPIPKYAKGTESHPGGHAIIAEAGRELVQEPGKPWRLYSEPTLANLLPGTVVKRNKITEEIISANQSALTSYLSYSKEDKHGEQTVSELRGVKNELKELNKKSRIVIINQGSIESTPWYQQQMKY